MMNEFLVLPLLPEALLWLAKSGLVILIAALFSLLLRKRPAAVRHTVWKAAFLAILLLPVLDALLPDYFGSTRQAPLRSVSTGRGMEDLLFRTAPLAPPAVASLATEWVPTPGLAAVSATTVPWGKIAALLWLGVSARLLLRLLASAWALRRLGRASALPGEAMATEFAAACRTMGVRESRVRLVLASGDHTPMTWGFFKPVVLLPEASLAYDPALRRSVFLHELAHVRRADFLWDTLARVIVALQWPSPFAWLAAAALDRERERACDAAVVSAGMCQRDYARDARQRSGGTGRTDPEDHFHRQNAARFLSRRQSALHGRGKP